MLSWIFRNRRRLEVVYGLEPAPERAARRAAARAAGASSGRAPGRSRDLVLVPVRRRAS